MQWLYTLHVGCACLSIGGFALRGIWMLTQSHLLQHRLVRVLPHAVDTVLLGSAMLMLWQMRLSPQDQPWLLAKLAGLFFYIGFGLVALRLGRTRRVRGVAYLLALLTAAYIVTVALSKRVWGFLPEIAVT